MIRGAPAVRMRPKFELLSPVVGLLNLAWFMTLKISQRNCSPFCGHLEGPRNREVVLELRRSDERVRLQVAVRAGGRRRERVPVEVVVHAFRCRRRSAAPAPRAVRPCRTVRCRRPVVTVNRPPLCQRTSGAICQSPKNGLHRVVLVGRHLRHQRDIDDVAPIGIAVPVVQIGVGGIDDRRSGELGRRRIALARGQRVVRQRAEAIFQASLSRQQQTVVGRASRVVQLADRPVECAHRGVLQHEPSACVGRRGRGAGSVDRVVQLGGSPEVARVVAQV